MNFVRRTNFANNESEQKLEGGDRQLVPRGSDHADQVDDDVKLTTTDLESLTRRISLTSTREIDSLIGELKTLRQKLATDGSRLESQLAEYAGLSQSVVKLTKIISESLTHLEKGHLSPKGRWLGNDTYGRGCSVELMVISGIDEKMEKVKQSP
jgi:uncharacterized phage infection (PIP) family protein YhgE